MIHLKKFAIREDWIPIKLDVSVEMPEELDISHLRGNGPQNVEKLLPETIGILNNIHFINLVGLCVSFNCIFCLFRSSSIRI